MKGSYLRTRKKRRANFKRTEFQKALDHWRDLEELSWFAKAKSCIRMKFSSLDSKETSKGSDPNN